MHDVIIVGGSYAGLAAALQLARARRDVLVIDAGQPRNRFARSAHGFLGRDGQAPGVIAAQGKADVLAYPTVAWREASVSAVRPAAEGFAVRMGDGEELESKRLILATGVVDELPPVPGLAERWGKSVFHCPYCHGYELQQGRIGVLATSPHALHMAALAAEWGGAGQTTLFLLGTFEPDAAKLAELTARRIVVERERVVAIAGEAPSITLQLQDGRSSALDGLFVVPRTHLGRAHAFAEQLGCELDAGPTGEFYKTDMTKETTRKGVFACGDSAALAGAVSFAVADGVMAGIAAHRSLVFGL